MESASPDWVPPSEGHTKALCMALRLLDQADRALPYNRDLSRRLSAEAVDLIGTDAVLTIFELQKAGRLPRCVTPEWGQFTEMAAAGDVEIATVILIRDREYVCEDRVAQRVRPAPAAPAAAPVSLADEMRAMGLM